MPVLTSTSPAASEVLSDSQPLMQQNTAYFEQSLLVDHNILGNTATAQDGYHKIIHFVNNVAGYNTKVSGVGQIYTATVGGDQQLFFINTNGTDTGVGFQLTTTSNSPYFGANSLYKTAVPTTIAQCTGGWTFLPGNLLMQYGVATTLNPGGSINVYYAKAFSNKNKIVSIVASPFTTSSIGGGTHDWDVQNANAAFFTLTINGNYNSTDSFFFQVIGNP